MISWHWFQSSHGTQWHFLPPFILCCALPSFIILFLSKPRRLESKQHHTNTTLHVFFSFCCEFFFSLFCVCVALALGADCKNYGFLCKWKWEKYAWERRQGERGSSWLERETEAPENWGLGFLQIRRSVQPALPLRAQQKENCGGKAFILTQLCQHFHPRATDAQSPLWTSSQISGFSAVMQTKSLITIFGLE